MRKMYVGQGRRVLAMLVLLGTSAAFQSATAQDGSGAGSAANPGGVALSKLPPGYLPRERLPDSLALLPPPPSPGSAALQRDEEARQSVAGLRGTARWSQASADAKLGFPEVAGDFSCAMAMPIDRTATPRLTALMERMMIDVGLSTYRAKNRYDRTRPFVVHSEPTCSLGDEAVLRTDGSYPSGHSALGWGWALVLAELNPDRADAIFARGRDFGESRLVCNVHWRSDVDAGRVIASATVARLHADPGFRKDLKAARSEVQSVRASGARPTTDCTAEAASLAMP